MSVLQSLAIWFSLHATLTIFALSPPFASSPPPCPVSSLHRSFLERVCCSCPPMTWTRCCLGAQTSFHLAAPPSLQHPPWPRDPWATWLQRWWRRVWRQAPASARQPPESVSTYCLVVTHPLHLCRHRRTQRSTGEPQHNSLCGLPPHSEWTLLGGMPQLSLRSATAQRMNAAGGHASVGGMPQCYTEVWFSSWCVSLSCLSPLLHALSSFTCSCSLHSFLLYIFSFFTFIPSLHSCLLYTFSHYTLSSFTPIPSSDSSFLYTPSPFTLPVFTLPFLLYTHSFSHLFLLHTQSVLYKNTLQLFPYTHFSTAFPPLHYSD